MYRTLVVVLCLFAASACAQDESAAEAAAQAACGPKDAKFDARQDKSTHPTPSPDPQKALVYVVQDIGEMTCKRCALTRLGMDGAWVGANQGSSYLFFWASPGEHHLCLNWQSVLGRRSRAVALTPFNAEAGKVYYFRARVFEGHQGNYFFDLDPINSDEGKYMVATSPVSVSHTKQ